jgi:hypothetical protein
MKRRNTKRKVRKELQQLEVVFEPNNTIAKRMGLLRFRFIPSLTLPINCIANLIICKTVKSI